MNNTNHKKKNNLFGLVLVVIAIIGTDIARFSPLTKDEEG